MHLLIIQNKLKSLGLYDGIIDGKDGPKTQKAVETFLTQGGVNFSKYTKENTRKIVAVEQLLYKQAGLEVGSIDGLVGPQTRNAREQFAELARTGKITYWRDDVEAQPVKEVAAPPAYQAASAKFPKQADVEKFYGKPGTGHTKLVLPYPMRLAWDKSSVVKSFAIHEKCHDSALEAFKKIQGAYTPDQISKFGFDLFGGCFNDRNMRGGTKKSMHAYACAIDFDPERNQLKWGKDKAFLARPECAEFIRIWQSVGWISLGADKNFDWMHVQAARL